MHQNGSGNRKAAKKDNVETRMKQGETQEGQPDGEV